MAQVGLDECKKLLDDTASETTDLGYKQLWKKYAKAQAWVSDSSSHLASSGGSPDVDRAVPFRKPTLSWYQEIRLYSKEFRSCKMISWLLKRIRKKLSRNGKKKNLTNAKYQKELSTLSNFKQRWKKSWFYAEVSFFLPKYTDEEGQIIK